MSDSLKGYKKKSKRIPRKEQYSNLGYRRIKNKKNHFTRDNFT